jgi:TetR/AcrR family acrAB operon transcriptional repressor
MTESNGKSANDERAVRILETAGDLIAHYGYDKTTMSDIAREAGVSKGALYLHWDSKEDLFEALYAYEAGRYLDDFVQMFDTEIGDWSFVRMFQVTFTLLQKHPFMLALMTRDQRVLGTFLRRRPDLMQQKGANNAELYRQLQKIGAARVDIEPEVIAYLLNAFSYGLLNAHEVTAPEDTPSFDAIINGMGKLLDRGLEPEGGGNRQAARELVLTMVESIQAQQHEPAAREENHD